MHYVYIAKNKSNNLYIGITQNPLDRLSHHNSKRGALFTKTNPSYEIVFLEKYASLIEARGREVQLKKWKRPKKEKLILMYSNGLETKYSRFRG